MAVPTQCTPAMLKNMMRQCAKDIGRPWVTAVAHFSYMKASGKTELHYWEITVPNDDRMAPIISMLLLGAVAIEHNKSYYNEPVPPAAYYKQAPNAKSKPLRRKFILGDDKLFDVWLKRCDTDPIFQKALGTLPKG